MANFQPGLKQLSQPSLLCDNSQLADGLDFDLADSVPCEVEGLGDFFGLDFDAVASEAEFHDLLLALAEFGDDVSEFGEDGFAHRSLFGVDGGFVADHAAEGSAAVADGEVEGEHFLTHTHVLLKLDHRDSDQFGEFLDGWLVSGFAEKFGALFFDATNGLGDVGREADGLRLVVDGSADGLADPVGGVG